MSELTYEQAMELRFDLCLKRLAKLREVGAPDSIIVKEVSMLIDRCALRYGGELLWQIIGEGMVRRARLGAGFCPYDDPAKGEVRRLAKGEVMCAECAAESDALNEVDESEFADDVRGGN